MCLRELIFAAYRHSHDLRVHVHGAAGGTVTLGSRNGVGSLVTVTMPLHLGEPAMPRE